MMVISTMYRRTGWAIAAVRRFLAALLSVTRNSIHQPRVVVIRVQVIACTGANLLMAGWMIAVCFLAVVKTLEFMTSSFWKKSVGTKAVEAAVAAAELPLTVAVQTHANVILAHQTASRQY